MPYRRFEIVARPRGYGRRSGSGQRSDPLRLGRWTTLAEIDETVALATRNQLTLRPLDPAAPAIRLGLRENWPQFSLLVLINAFVGGMVGIERTVVPLIGSEEFHIKSTTLITSFIISFGVVKAVANLVSGYFADTWGRKRVLVVGWILSLPVPFMIIAAPAWGWIVAANILLGLSQGFAWSMTVLMKVDLVGPKNRGLAVGLNEFAGYFAVGATAFLTGYLASLYGLRPVPIYLGVIYACAGLALSVLVVRDTRQHVQLEAAGLAKANPLCHFERSLPSPRSRTGTCLRRRKPGLSTTSMTA